MRPGTGGITLAGVTTFQDGPAGWSRKFRRFLSWETENDVGWPGNQSGANLAAWSWAGDYGGDRH